MEQVSIMAEKQTINRQEVDKFFSFWYHARLTLRPWGWRWYFPPKRWLTFTKLHVITSQNIVCVIAVRSANVTLLCFLAQGACSYQVKIRCHVYPHVKPPKLLNGFQRNVVFRGVLSLSMFALAVTFLTYSGDLQLESEADYRLYNWNVSWVSSVFPGGFRCSALNHVTAPVFQILFNSLSCDAI
jgi:hypothetical protein